MRDSNYHYLTSSLTSFGQPFDNDITKGIAYLFCDHNPFQNNPH